jgi:hypothetical protein
VPITQPMEISRFVWWSLATLILFCAISSIRDRPGHPLCRQAQRPHQHGPSWWTQQKFGSSPRATSPCSCSYAGLVERFSNGPPGISNRMAWLVGLGTTAVLVGDRSGRLPRDAMGRSATGEPRASGVRALRSGRPSFAPIDCFASRRSSS